MYRIPIYKISLVRDGSHGAPSRTVTDSRTAAQIIKAYLDGVDREHFVVLMLDRRNKVIGINTVSMGSLSASVVHPREVFKPAIISNANSVICAHNHPSGDVTPSREDDALTQRLIECGHWLGIEVLDHVIVGDGTDNYYSYKDEGRA